MSTYEFYFVVFFQFSPQPHWEGSKQTTVWCWATCCVKLQIYNTIEIHPHLHFLQCLVLLWCQSQLRSWLNSHQIKMLDNKKEGFLSTWSTRGTNGQHCSHSILISLASTLHKARRTLLHLACTHIRCAVSTFLKGLRDSKANLLHFMVIDFVLMFHVEIMTLYMD